MTPEEFFKYLPLLAQIPIVGAVMVFIVYILQLFLRHIDAQETKRIVAEKEREQQRIDAAALKERERLDREESKDAAIREYLSKSRDSYLAAIATVTSDATKGTISMTTAVTGLSAHTSAMTELLARHDSGTLEALRGINDTLKSLNEDLRRIRDGR